MLRAYEALIDYDCLETGRGRIKVIDRAKKVAPAKRWSNWIAHLWQRFAMSSKNINMALLEKTIIEHDMISERSYVFSILNANLTFRKEI